MGGARKRFFLAAAVVVMAIGALVTWSLTSTAAYYLTPSEVKSSVADTTETIRIAGTVVPGSVERTGPTTTFDLSDGGESVTVTTDALLPDTFTEGFEVVAEGSVTTQGILSATSVLAKCPSKFKAKLANK